MDHLAVLTPVHVALNELELAPALVLLAEQESTPVDETLPRLRRALATVHEARDLASEVADALGRPALRVIDRHGCLRRITGGGVSQGHDSAV